MRPFHRAVHLTIWRPVVLALVLIGCAHTVVVEIPPRVDLRSFQTIGIVEFSSHSSNSTDKLNQLATQQLMAVIQKAQPHVRFLELGSPTDLLKAVDRERLDPGTMKAIGKKYGVTSVFTGTYEISDVKPKVSLGQDLSSLNASAVVNMALTSKQWDTATGATLWTNSRYGEWPIANVEKETGRPVSFSMSLPEDRYGHFIAKLIYGVTDDFRPHYEKRKVPRS